MRVPDAAGKGKAKVTLSFAAWKEGKVVPATFEIEIEDALPSEQPRPSALPARAQTDAEQRRSVPVPSRTDDSPSDNAGNLIRLLVEKSVHEELKLSEEQLRKLPEFRLNFYRKRAARGLGNVPIYDQEVRVLAGRELNDMIDKELKGFLSGDQHKRLVQIELQVRAADGWGLVTVLRGPEVAKELNLSAAQKEVLAAIRKDIQDSYLKRADGFSVSGGREDREKNLADYRRSNNDKIEQMLTDAQKAKWREMIGPKFKEKIDLRGH